MPLQPASRKHDAGQVLTQSVAVFAFFIELVGLR